MVISNFALFAFTIIFLIMTTMSDPGFIREGVDFLRLVEEFDATQLCPECQILRTIRSRHCGVCHQCVERFDHHCPWINNCIGVNNHNFFLCYIFTQYALLIHTLASHSLAIMQFLNYKGQVYNQWFNIYAFQTDGNLFYPVVGTVLLCIILFMFPLRYITSPLLSDF